MKFKPHSTNPNSSKSILKYNQKPPKLGGGQGVPANSTIANALGVSLGMPVHQGSLNKLLTHPDPNVVSAAKKALGKKLWEKY